MTSNEQPTYRDMTLFSRHSGFWYFETISERILNSRRSKVHTKPLLVSESFYRDGGGGTIEKGESRRATTRCRGSPVRFILSYVLLSSERERKAARAVLKNLHNDAGLLP